MTWGFPSAFGEGLELPPPPPTVRNSSPCRRCGFAYPFRGSPAQLRELVSNLAGLCPACFHGHSRPLAADPELAGLLSRGRGWSSASRLEAHGDRRHTRHPA